MSFAWPDGDGTEGVVALTYDDLLPRHRESTTPLLSRPRLSPSSIRGLRTALGQHVAESGVPRRRVALDVWSSHLSCDLQGRQL